MATTAEPAVRMSRRHAAGAGNARGLLLTVLGEFVLPDGGSAWTSTFIEALGRLAVEAKTTRQALTRTASAGWLAADRVGRRTRWQLTGSGRRLLVEGTERIYGFPPEPAGRDGQWLLVLARVPDSDRALRHRLRTGLSWAGFGSPSPGVWLSPDPGRAEEAERILADTGLLAGAQLLLASHRAGALSALVGQAWDLPAIDDEYHGFIEQFSDGAATDPLAGLIELVHAWRRFPAIDPALPADLLPDGWSGRRAAELFHRRHAEWQPAARRTWQKLDQQGLD